MTHHMAEVAARRRHHPGFYLPGTFDPEGWRRRIVVLVRLEEGWEGAALHRPRPKPRLMPEDPWVPPENHQVSPERVRADPYGELITVRLDLTELARQEMDEDDPLPEVAVTQCMMWQLGHALATGRVHMANFQRFVYDGDLEREL